MPDRKASAITAYAAKALLLTGIVAAAISIARASGVNFDKLLALATQRYGENSRPPILELQSTMAELQNAPEAEKLARINSFFNRNIRIFDTDTNIWGQSDYWATPLESLGKGRGDCEDYSIAKFVFLKKLNIPQERLRLTYVRAQIGGPHSRIFQAHMVVSYYPTSTAEPLILDNLISDIRPASRRMDLFPIYSFDEEGLWLGTNSAPNASATAHLSRWRDVLLRMKNEGID